MPENKVNKNNIENLSPLSVDDTPLKLSGRQKELCRRLDRFYKVTLKENVSPSILFRGALYAMRPSNRKQNPDWMAQAAHSLRDILYPFYNSRAILKRGDAFMQYGSAGDIGQLDKFIGQYLGLLTDIAHHNLTRAATNPIINGSRKNPVLITEEIFDNIVTGFERLLFEALRRQIDAHKEIDLYIKKDIRDLEILLNLLDFNYDARRYFYSRANENWLDWLWKKGFLDVIKEKSEVTAQYSYRTPELDYLVKIACKEPKKVVDIIHAIAISPQHFNPEVIDRFLLVCQSLPAKQLARIVPKIRDEKWIALMEKYNLWGFEYEKMMGILEDAKEYSALLILAEAVLEVRDKKEISKEDYGLSTESPFYFRDLGETKVFDQIIGIDDIHLEPALAMVTRVLGNIVNLGDTNKTEIFDIDDKYLFFDVDLFTIEMDERKNRTYRDDMRSFAAVIKTLAQRLIGSKCSEADVVKHLYEKHFKPLPNSQSVWRLNLFVLSLCPKVFKDELKAALFKIFDLGDPWPLESGAEYKWALKKGFSSLSPEDREIYVSRLLSCIKDEEEKGWQKKSAWRLLSSAFAGLTAKQRKRAQEVLGEELDPDFQPKASIGEIKAGFVSPKAPIDQNVLSQMSVPEIVEMLKKTWAPEQLRNQDREQDFLRPLNAEGMSNLLKADIKKRLNEYIANALLFFDRDHLDSYYTYSFLRGVYDVLREKKFSADVEWSGLFKLYSEIVDSAKTCEFVPGTREKEISDYWLVGWDGVHLALADVLLELQKESGDKAIIDFSSFRKVLMKILHYLLSYPDPEPGSELKKIDTIEKDPQTGADIHTGSDPFTAASNSVRGRAFEVFVHFTEKDGLSLHKKTSPKLSADVKELYKKCLDAEKTQSVMFLFGHYLAFFYYRDRKWVRGVIPQIFPIGPTSNNLYLAAWEGYLAGTLYKELFEELSDYYRQAIILDPKHYTQRRYFRDLDKGLATHVALAFIHFSNFDINSELFKLFWKTKITKRHKEFISFLGRSCISRENAKKWIEARNIDIKKLMKFWNWALENSVDPEALSGFSFWIEVEHTIFDPVWLAKHVRQTLEKTEGYVEWDYGIMQSLEIMAEKAPEDTLKILKLYLLGTGGLTSRRPWLYVDNELMDIFTKLYKNPVTREGTYSLIDELLPIGSGQFWKLKDVINRD